MRPTFRLVEGAERRPSCAAIVSIACAMFLASAATEAGAAAISVNTTDDVVADDGACSLREAISAVNGQAASGVTIGECEAGDGIGDVIAVPRGLYTLELGAAGDDANAGGDLDITRSVIISGLAGKTTVQNGIGEKRVLGDGDRVFHVDPPAAGDVDVTIRGLRVRYGDVTCDGALCDAGAGGIDAINGRDLTIENCVIDSNVTSCTGEDCGNPDPSGAAGGVLHGPVGNLTVRATTFTRNNAVCFDVDCLPGEVALSKTDGGALPIVDTLLEDVLFLKNAARCEVVGCDLEEVVDLEQEDLTMTRVTFSGNSSFCEGEDCDTDEILDVSFAGNATLDGVVLGGNKISCDGAFCTQDPMFSVGGLGTLTVIDTEVTRNKVSCKTVVCDTDEIVNFGSDGVFTVSNLVIETNKIQCKNTACDVDPVAILGSGSALDIDGLVVGGNKRSCQGVDCSVDANVVLASDVSVDLLNGAFTRNKAQCKGDFCEVDGMVVVSSLGDASIGESLFDKNQSKATGGNVFPAYAGALYVTVDGATTIDQVTVTKNRSSGDGGGIAIDTGTVTITSSIIVGNRAADFGGGIVNDDTIVSITDTQITDNRADSGGGIGNFGTLGSLLGTTTVADNDPDDCVNLDTGTGCP